jgi:cysteine desulfurase/selenocysteine lyase
MSLAEFKKAFSSFGELTHLNNAGLAPTAAPARDLVNYWIERFHREGVHCNDDYLAAVETARGQLARLIGSESGEIAFFQSTAGAVSQMAFGMKLNPGDEVVMWDQEYSSNLYPWKEACERSGAKLVLVPSGDFLATPAEKLVSVITERTKVLAISWVQFQTGAVTDLKPLVAAARARNIWTVVDVIQGMGVRPFHFADLGVDAICGGSHKWLVSPVGVGYLALRKERTHEIRPLMVGSGTYGTCDDPSSLVCEPKLSAAKFEAGSRQVLEIVALGASCELLAKAGVENILAEAERLAGSLRRGLENQGYSIHSPQAGTQKGPIVNFGERADTERLLKAQKISYVRRGPGLRFSPHAFNTDEDIERVLKVLS